jgi:hypothetical protein
MEARLYGRRERPPLPCKHARPTCLIGSRLAARLPKRQETAALQDALAPSRVACGDLSGCLVSGKSELICLLRPRLVIGVALQHCDNSITNEKDKSRSILQIRKHCPDITNLHVRQITPDCRIGKHNKMCEETNAAKLSPTNLCVRQLLPNDLKLLAGLFEHHIKHCLFKRSKHGQSA